MKSQLNKLGKSKSFLNRYTNLPVLLDILVHKHLVLLDPSSWEDRNDSYYLERYKAEKNLKTVLALCFSRRRETFHQWKVFSSGPGGVCIEFDEAELLRGLSYQKGFRLRNIRYELIKTIRSTTPKIMDWPFIKRIPFKDEDEFRIVYENRVAEEATKEIPIPISSILKITLSPWMPESVASSVTGILNGLPDCGAITVQRSSLLQNAVWQAAIKPKK